MMEDGLSYLERPEEILSFIVECQENEIPCTLCVVTDVVGGSVRSVGTLIAVSRDGKMAGYVSHGCVDADLICQAQEAISQSCPRQIVYGAGSPFLDLNLPCGGKIEILIDPKPAREICRAALGCFSARRECVLQFSAEEGLISVTEQHVETGWSAGIFSVSHAPPLKLVIAGLGPPLIAVATLVQTFRYPCVILSPDKSAERLACDAKQKEFWHLSSPKRSPDFSLDRWSALLLLFHDHNWETQILRYALTKDPFYIGALGSASTHQKRLSALRKLGVEQHDLSKISGPIGVIQSARDAHTLAISSLAEILIAHRAFLSASYKKSQTSLMTG